ncbi:Ribonuclease H-like domain containing protein [Lactarius tabidus]
MQSPSNPATKDDFEWYHSEGDDKPMQVAPGVQVADKSEAQVLVRGQRRGRAAKMAEALQYEKEDEDGNPIQHHATARSFRKPRQAKRQRISTISVAPSSDEDDEDFKAPLESGSDDDTGSWDDPSNTEVADILPSKTIPTTGRGASSKRKRSTHGVAIEEIEGEGPHQMSNRSKTSTNHTIDKNGIVGCHHQGEKISGRAKSMATRNPIYYFYERVERNANGEIGNAGDKHYRCFHGNRKVVTITKKMKYSLNGVIGHLKSTSSLMYRLYLVMKECSPAQITQEEIEVASGKKLLDPASDFLSKLESANENIRRAFDKQVEAATSPWDQEKFEYLLAKWVVATDQPFDTVDQPEFRDLMTYAHHPLPSLKIPHRPYSFVKEDVEGKISIAIDAWTSSNNYAFMAIVAHYVNKVGQLEELLINFRELEGEHSGANMAEAVWETLVCFGIENQIMAFMLDNASNNDTLVDEIVKRAKEQGIYMNASWVRLRCMPHTVHLAALKLLEGIGAISEAESKKATSRSRNYQDSATTPLSRQFDDTAAAQGDEDEQEGPSFEVNCASDIIPAVEKLRKIIRAIQSSPQRKQTWLAQVAASTASTLGCNNDNHPRQPLVLILDVKTRWLSTHQMMRRALDFQKDIDDFVARNRDLCALELSEDEGLKEHIQGIYRNLPSSTPSRIKAGLLDAHKKLSDYYYRYDQSPFYTWAALLDPRISYEGAREDYADDPDLLEYLEVTKSKLTTYYIQHYVNHATASHKSVSDAARSVTSDGSPSKVNFTLRYKKKENVICDELEEYFKLPREDFDACSAVAVERIFSGGRDTISLQRASLQPETIRMLMVLKQRLRLVHTAINKTAAM